jgi:hypothetical protein
MLTIRTIAGHSIALAPGRRYLASRPMARSQHHRRAYAVREIAPQLKMRVQVYPVTIRDITDGDSDLVVMTVGPLDYDAANEFLGAFNDGEISFSGRIWE